VRSVRHAKSDPLCPAGKPLPKQDRIVQDLVGLFNKDNRTGKQESRRHSSGSSSTTTHKKVANDEATFALRPSL